MEERLLVECEEEEKRVGVGGWVGELKEEGKRVGWIAGPMVAVNLSQYTIQLISTMMVGHLGQLELSSAAIATSLSAVTGFNLLQGMACGLETLCGQAYGAKQYEKLGMHTFSAVISLFLACFPISLIWLFMGKFLTIIGQDPLISAEAGKYVVSMIPGLFAFGTYHCIMKFLQSQHLIVPMVISSGLTLSLHIPLCYILVFKFGFGNVGAALSISISYWVNVFILRFYIKHSESCKATRIRISMEAVRGIKEFLKLGLPSALMMCLEWWSFHLLILLSGFLPNAKLETSMLSICLNCITCLYSIPYGLSTAGSVRVSNELGAGNPKGARLAARVVMLIAVTVGITISTILFSLRRIIGYAFSNEKEVTDYFTEMVPILCIQVFMDNLQGTLSGFARGCGWQKIAAYANLGAYYLVGIPLAVGLGFLLQMGGMGLRIGILGGSTVQSILLAIVTSCVNWQQQANMARNRVFEEKIVI